MEQEAERKTYNGWANYETWLVNLWLTNEPQSEKQLQRICHGKVKDWERAEALKTWVEQDYLPELPASLASDLIGAALGEVDWVEIVQNHQDD